MNTSQCAPAKHHYDECAERVTKQIDENGKADEDCVEECMYLQSVQCLELSTLKLPPQSSAVFL